MEKKTFIYKKFNENQKIEILKEAQRLNSNTLVARIIGCNEKTLRISRNQYISK